MLFQVGSEKLPEGRFIGWVLGHPGCFAYGLNEAELLAKLPEAIRDYALWIAQSEPEAWLPVGEVMVEIVETWKVYAIDSDFERSAGGYEVESFFLHDWKALTELEVERARKLLAWSRIDLLDSVRALAPAQIVEKQPGERWSIAGILGHVGGAEWWYLERLGLAFERADVPAESFERLTMVRARLEQALPQLIGAQQVVGRDGELWSPRKLLRRAIWHERDHTEHILKLVRGE